MPNELISQEDIQLIDPKDLKRLLVAAEIMKLHIQDGMSLDNACAQCGISRSTYARWVRDGVFAPLIQAQVGPAIQTLRTQALTAMSDGMTWLVEVASGHSKDATNFDRMAAIRFMWDKLIDPLITQGLPEPVEQEEEEHDPAAAYLAAEPEWAKDLEPGEKRVRTEIVERQVPTTLVGEFHDIVEDPEPEEPEEPLEIDEDLREESPEDPEEF